MCKQEDYPTGRYRKRRMHELSINEKINVVHDILIGQHYQKDIALKYRITAQLVRTLVKKAKGNKEFFNELRMKEDEKRILE